MGSGMVGVEGISREFLLRKLFLQNHAREALTPNGQRAGKQAF